MDAAGVIGQPRSLLNNVVTAHTIPAAVHRLSTSRSSSGQNGRVASEKFTVQSGTARLAAERWPGDGQPVVLLHSGVTDRRSWYAVADALQPATGVVAYDMRGYGETSGVTYGFSHLDDLNSVLDRVATGPVWLVGSSMGGEIAIDAVLASPERVAGLVLLAPAVSGAPEPSVFDADYRPNSCVCGKPRRPPVRSMRSTGSRCGSGLTARAVPRAECPDRRESSHLQ